MDLFETPVPETMIKYQQIDAYFLEIFCSEILGLGDFKQPDIATKLSHFINDPEISKVYRDVQNQFSDFQDYSSQIQSAFKYYKYHFPEKNIPRIITFVSGFNYGILTLDSTLAIGLDMFLGKNYAYYINLQFPQYKRQNMQPQRLVYTAMQGWLKSDFQTENPNESLLSKMVNSGKVLYAMDAIFPFGEDSMKINYTSEQINWAKQNELAAWTYLVDEQLLYEKSYSKIYKFINEAPFTAAFKSGSAPRMGEYLGWKIVRSFMEKNAEVTLDSLMNIRDEQYILVKSNYKPER